MVTEYVTGRLWMEPDFANPQRLARLGDTLRRLHELPPPDLGRFDLLQALSRYVERVGAEASYLDWAEAAWRVSGAEDRPLAILHHDLHGSNLIETPDRLVLIGRIAASVAHEMGTPLNVIDGRAVQLLQRPDAPIEMRQRNLTIIREQTRRIAQVVRQLLDLSRTDRISREPVDLAQVFSDVGELIEVEANRNGVSVEIVAGPPICIEGDKDMLRQVFLNLCINAIQAMPQGGQLRLECQPDGQSKNGREFILAQVSDSGTGIAPKHLPQIFDPFFTTKDIGQGTGLGLAVSRRIVEDHGGWIAAANHPSDQGAVFTVFLPRYQAQPQESVAQVAAAVGEEVR